ncbi:hypothetical protein HMPREF1572_01333 [Gardnerella vaginalis JCP7275]|nr:hypothetical protein HMPREF1572_01333 [Gardnerella vaginalis JCP7275]
MRRKTRFIQRIQRCDLSHVWWQNGGKMVAKSRKVKNLGACVA